MNESIPTDQNDYRLEDYRDDGVYEVAAPAPEAVPGMPESESERRTIRGLIAVGLAAGSVFLGACAQNGVDHKDSKAYMIVNCDVSDVNNLPQAEVSLVGGPYSTSIAENRTITNGDEMTRIDTIQAFNISCIERRPDGIVISQEMPNLDIGVPGNPFREYLQFWQLGGNPDIASRIDKFRKVSYALELVPDAAAAEGFSISTLHLTDSYIDGSRGSAAANGNSVSVDFSRLDGPDSVQIESVTVSEGPGLGLFGEQSMLNGVQHDYS